ncbi:hypothetical protein [Paenibacillus terrae]|uniref:hypothetical protein n=1 Tax=Paenibacillus terrae TaxID=159743 RepID=UPI0011EB75D5|nr:hypothetical protein [Paenibacillus terrae]
MAQQGYEIGILHCAADYDSLDGVIITNLKAGIVDGTAPHAIETELPETVIVHVDVEQAADRLQLNLQKQEIDSLTEQISISRFTLIHIEYSPILPLQTAKAIFRLDLIETMYSKGSQMFGCPAKDVKFFGLNLYFHM